MNRPGSELTAGRSTWLIWAVAAVYAAATISVAVRATPAGSPDEAANAFFIHRQALTGRAAVVTDLTPAELAYAYPRSMIVQGNQLLSGSFLGLVQVGGLVERWFGSGASQLVVPLLSAFALVAFYGLVRTFWSSNWSLVGTALLAINPVWFQFQTLPMFHNGAFASMLVITGYCLRRQFLRPSWRWAVAVGLAYGAAVYFRPIEAIWSGPLIAIVLLSLPGRWKWFWIVVGLTSLAQLPWLRADRNLYGSVLATGYTPAGAISTTDTSTVLTSLWKLVTPPGGWSLHFLSSTWWYLVLLLPASSALTAVAIASYFRRKFISWKKVLKLLVLSAFMIFPLVYYGSWDLYPLLPASRVGSLASYDRYWLPLFTAMVPAVTLMLRRIWQVQRAVAVSMLSVLLISQLIMIIWHPESGLLARWNRQAQARTTQQVIISRTPASAVIIAGQDDKYLVGQRLTAFALPDSDSQWVALERLVVDRPVFLLRSATSQSPAEVAAALLDHRLELGSAASLPGDELWLIMPKKT